MATNNIDNGQQTIDAPRSAVITIDIGSTIIKIGAVSSDGAVIFYRHIPIKYISIPPSDTVPLDRTNTHSDSAVRRPLQSSTQTTANTRTAFDSSSLDIHCHPLHNQGLHHHSTYGQSTQNHPLNHTAPPPPLATFSLNHTDVQQWFTLIADTISGELLQHNIVVSALIVSGQAPTLLALDSNDTPLQPVLFRQSLETARLQIATATISGVQSSFLPLAVHYKQRFSARYQRVVDWLPLPEFIAYRFGATRCAMVPSQQYEVFYWTAEQIERCGLQLAHFPPLIVAGKQIGTVHSDIAARWNQSRSIPILSGGLDFMFTLIGSNSSESGIWCDRAGSSYGINIATNRSVTTPLFMQYPHPVAPQRHNLSLIINSDLSYHLAPIMYEIATDFLSYTTYIPAQLPPPLSLSVEKPGIIHIPKITHNTRYRSYLIAEALLFIIEVVTIELKSLQVPLTEIHLSGGQARSATWNMLKAIACGTTTTSYQVIDTEIVGMAALTWHSLQHYATLEQAVRQMSVVKQTYTPTTPPLSMLNRHLTARFHTFVNRLPIRLRSSY